MKMRRDLRRKKKQRNKEVTTKKLPKEFSEMYPDLKKEGWGTNELTQQIDNSFCNIGTSFINLKSYFKLLEKAWEIFNDVNKLLSFSTLDGLIAISLVGRTAGCFLGAVRLSCSGQLTETWVLLRACLENSLYAFYIFKNPERAEIWSKRHSGGEESVKECKSTFVIRKIWDELAQKSKDVAKEVGKWYDTSIDFGGHPNERSIFQNLERKQNGDGFNFKIINPDPAFMRSTIISTVIISSIVLRIFSLTFQDSLSQPNLAIKLQNLNNESRPLMYSTAMELRKLQIE